MAQTDPVAFFTLWLVVFTAVLSGVGVIQLKLLTRAETVAEKSAKAVQQSADVAKTALISAQRAFLFVNTFETHVIKNEFRILPQWKNSGTTQANPVKNYANWRAFIGTPPADYTDPDLAADGTDLPTHGQGLEFYIGPQDAIYSESLNVPMPLIERIRNKELRLFIWGWAEYRDAFEGTPIHRSQFCNEVIVTDMGREGDKVTVAVSFAKYGPYNKAN
jgi:hypothetical protein